MRVAIVGSREYPRLLDVVHYVRNLPRDTEVVSGGARGVDRVAEQAAQQRGLAVRVFHADWDRLGKRAGYVRNEEIVRYCDRVVAFYDGISKGTWHTIELARKARKPVIVYELRQPLLVRSTWTVDGGMVRRAR